MATTALSPAISPRAAPAPLAVSTVAGQGAVWAATAAMLYALVFGLYAALRAHLFVAAARPPQPGMDLAAFDVTLLYLALMFGVQLLLVVVPLGVITALLVWGITARLPRGRGFAVAAGVIVSLALCAGIGYFLPTLTGDRMSPTVYPATFWFWLGLPAIFYVLTAALGAARLARRLG